MVLVCAKHTSGGQYFLHLHESFSSLGSLQPKGSPCISRGSSSTGNASTLNQFTIRLCRALVTHVEALTRWHSCGQLELVLATGSHTAGAQALCMDLFLLGVELGLACYRRLLCYKNGGVFGGPFPS